MATNDFLPFCETDTGSNLLSQSDYSADSQRSIGNQPGIARATLVNKVLRQSTFITSQIAQFIADKAGVNVLDDADTTKLLAQMNAALLPLPPIVTKYTSGSGTHNLNYVFFIASGSATAGATYTHNSTTYTVSTTVASGTQITMSGGSAPLASGTLTKASGTGDSTLNFYAVRAPTLLRVKMVGGGGGGGGSSTLTASDGGVGGNGQDTTFGSSFLTATGGGGGQAASNGGSGGNATIGAGAVGLGFNGGRGEPARLTGISTEYVSAGNGASSYFGGDGGGGYVNTVGLAAAANTGSGGGGAGAPTANANSARAGGGGGAGAFIDAFISSPNSSYAYSVGSGGSGGLAGTSGFVGGAGAAGIIFIEAHFQ